MINPTQPAVNIKKAAGNLRRNDPATFVDDLFKTTLTTAMTECVPGHRVRLRR